MDPTGKINIFKNLKWRYPHQHVSCFIPRAAMTSIFEGQPVNPSKQALLNDQNKGHLGSR